MEWDLIVGLLVIALAGVITVLFIGVLLGMKNNDT
jgi:hypothetical protein